LAAIGRSEELKSALFFEQFLLQEDQKNFEKYIKVAAKIKYARTISDLISTKGEVGVQMTQSSPIFCGRMSDFIDSY